MNTRRRIAHFRTNPRFSLSEVPGPACTITDPVVREALAASLAVFQLGAE